MTLLLSSGIEIETHGVSVSTAQRALDDNGIKGCKVKPDGTPSVDAEIVFTVRVQSLTPRQRSHVEDLQNQREETRKCHRMSRDQL